MGSYSDSASDLDEDLPVFNFLQPGRHPSQASQSHTHGEEAAISSAAKGNIGACTEVADVMMISSESDDDEPNVPLVQRLHQKQDNVIGVSSTVVNGKDAEQYQPPSLAVSQLSCQNGFSESEHPLNFHQKRTVTLGVSDGSEELAALPQRWLPLKPLSGAGITDTSPAKGTAKEFQSFREEALRRRQARQQRGNEVLRQKQERQKAERKALAEAAKALRPEECIKYMVVAVDPGKKETKNLALCRSGQQNHFEFLPCGCLQIC